MRTLDLSPRLAAVAAWVPAGAGLVDVGTDHAYLPVSLLLSGRISAAIVTDLRPGPLDHARRTAETYAVSNVLDFRLCDGLAAVAPEECTVVTVTGMGGETIAGILAHAPWTRQGKTLILQPQSTQDVLRRFLAENGYRVRYEQVVREGERWYPVLLAEGGAMPGLSAGEALAGRPESWHAQPERRDYLLWLLRRTQRQLDGLRRSAKPEDDARRRELEEAADFLTQQLQTDYAGGNS